MYSSFAREQGVNKVRISQWANGGGIPNIIT